MFRRHINFPHTHNLAELITILEKSGCAIPESVKKSVVLTDYAVGTRYPGVAEPVTKEEYKEAINLAENVLEWVKRQLS